MAIVQPGRQRTTGVERKAKMLIRLKQVEEGEVAVLVGRLEYPFKIPNRLVVVQDQTELD